MARLQDGDFVLEVRIVEVDDVLERYHVGLLRGGRPVIDPALLRPVSPSELRPVPAGFFYVASERETSLIDAVESWAAARRPAVWSPANPDIVISVSTERGFPYHLEHKLAPAADPADADPDQRAELDLVLGSQYGTLGPDIVEILVGVDGAQLVGGEGYTGPVLLTRFVVRWGSVEEFARDLRREFEALAPPPKAASLF